MFFAIGFETMAPSTALTLMSGIWFCPSSYDLGENLRLVLLSVTKGEDKPLKYPVIFNTSDVAVLTKMDLAEAVEFEFATACANIQRVRPGMEVLTVSSRNGAGMGDWLQFLVSACRIPNAIHATG